MIMTLKCRINESRRMNIPSGTFKVTYCPKPLLPNKPDYVMSIKNKTFENILGKRRKCWLPAFFPVSQNVFKYSFKTYTKLRLM